jgi:hypothetical protein
MFSPEKVEHELLELQMLHEIGEIPDEEFTRRENELLDRLDELMLAKGVLQDVEEDIGQQTTSGPLPVVSGPKEGEIPIPKAK